MARRAVLGALVLGSLVSLAPAPATSSPAIRTTLVSATTFTTTVDPAAATCTEVRRPVAWETGLPKDAVLAGTLCVPTRWAPGPHAVDVLVHGGMYNRQYWDWPVRPEVYSYVRRTVAAGRAAFFYDRFGVGASTRPKSREASFDNDVYGLHQIIGWLRDTYPVVDTVGHSLGSVMVAHEAGTYQDVDHVVLTGLTHGHGLGFLLLPTAIYTAFLDPQFADDITLRDGAYITTLPDKRAGLFYSASAEPDVIAYDEAHKDVMTLSQTRQAITQLTLPPLFNRSNQIIAPVLMVVGQQDAPFCNVDVSCASDMVLSAAELPYFTGAARFAARTVPDTGHDLPLHPSAGASFDIINDWLTTP
jgi:Serine aminopeptidase, S33